MANSSSVSVGKRRRINNSKKVMFIAIASTAFITGMALVVSFFLVQQIIFYGKVIGEKQNTITTVRSNIDAVGQLAEAVRALETNAPLNTIKSSDDGSALQVILDALPTESNADALGASLQIKFVGAVNGLSLETLEIDDVSAQDAAGDDAEAASPYPGLGFVMSVSGSADALRELLVRFEQSIRVIRLNAVTVEAGVDRLTMNIIGEAYYQPSQVVRLESRVVKP